MDNRELAKLLTEAAELLNEGARYRKELKDENGYSSKKMGDIAARINAIAEENYDESMRCSDEAKALPFYRKKRKEELRKYENTFRELGNRAKRNSWEFRDAGKIVSDKIDKKISR